MHTLKEDTMMNPILRYIRINNKITWCQVIIEYIAFILFSLNNRYIQKLCLVQMKIYFILLVFKLISKGVLP